MEQDPRLARLYNATAGAPHGTGRAAASGAGAGNTGNADIHGHSKSLKKEPGIATGIAFAAAGTRYGA
jgi:hypothetical protein